MTTAEERQALQNLIYHFKLSFKLEAKINFDMRSKTKWILILDESKNLSSPSLDFNQMQHYILGIGAGMVNHNKQINLSKVQNITSRVSVNLFGKQFKIIVSPDLKGGDRIYIQVSYESPCTNTGNIEVWKGRKFYLSEFMTEDEVIKTCYVAFESAVKHEVMESFKVDGIILFNPHINFEELLKVSHKEVKRQIK